MRMNWEYCMQRECKNCFKRILCERGSESNGKRAKPKTDKGQPKSKRATRKGSDKTKGKHSKKKIT